MSLASERLENFVVWDVHLNTFLVTSKGKLSVAKAKVLNSQEIPVLNHSLTSCSWYQTKTKFMSLTQKTAHSGTQQKIKNVFTINMETFFCLK